MKIIPVALAGAVVATVATVALASLSAGEPARRTTPPAPVATGERAAAPASSTPVPSPSASPEPSTLTGHSVDAPSSPWVVVNKVRPLPADFRPDVAIVRGYQVATVVADPLERLMADADAAGLGLKIASAFRSYGYQEQVFAATVAARGREDAERVSARPGHSEHQTGLAVDFVTPADTRCSFDVCFADQPAGKWLATHAWEYGFVVRYRSDNRAITGYQPEPWHLRYVGADLAADLRTTGVTTLEEYFGVPGGDYAR